MCTIWCRLCCFLPPCTPSSVGCVAAIGTACRMCHEVLGSVSNDFLPSVLSRSAYACLLVLHVFWHAGDGAVEGEHAQWLFAAAHCTAWGVVQCSPPSDAAAVHIADIGKGSSSFHYHFSLVSSLSGIHSFLSWESHPEGKISNICFA